ncbi:helix-turn-helix transcriptional regulator [Salmonella enterica]|nr:XRE family transcriptional regulator [Salmonella enterica subsp. enterica serovar Oranienburg]EDR0969341.1 helix-turn-helix transcriptional regulator [Salmonella enterica subsp. enterica serovar Thompson]EIM7761621.1 helix-turn-helix transcriptional regulator [Salmonella enterica]EJB3410684.1 helix-turn-helix transcriptional regulator [Salmonella enterica]EJG4770707.1 helix-turn-helix transcriptional regulator [Salmonella enterica]
MSNTIGKKIRAIREAEGLTRTQFFELTGILETVQKSYETGKRENIGIETVMKITNHPRFEKYTLWLMSEEGKTNESAGQVSPALSPDGLDSTSSRRNAKRAG